MSITFWYSLAMAGHPQTPMDIAKLTKQPDKFHNKIVHVQGIVTSVCKDEGCFIDLVPLSGKGDGVLASARHGVFKFPKDSVGKVATIKGTFYSKIYPFSRMDHWHHHGWRAWENDIPRFAKLYRIEADSFDLKEQRKKMKIKETSLKPHTSMVFDLDQMEFEAARMGAGKKCLDPGASTPKHSTRRYHELIFTIEGTLTIKMGNNDKCIETSSGKACYIPPNTDHIVFNPTNEKACYIFVYSLSDKSEVQPGKKIKLNSEKHDH